MRELFGDEDEEQSVQPDSELVDDDGSSDSPVPHSPGKQSDDVAEEQEHTPPPTDRQKQRLKQMMDNFVEHLSQETFADRCSASQLVQAISLPLLVASAGRDCEWFIRSEAQHWVLLTVDRLFRVRNTGSGLQGLISIVRRRYEAEGRLGVFSQVVGDGTLWLALIHAISGIEWNTTAGN